MAKAAQRLAANDRAGEAVAGAAVVAADPGNPKGRTSRHLQDVHSCEGSIWQVGLRELRVLNPLARCPTVDPTVDPTMSPQRTGKQRSTRGNLGKGPTVAAQDEAGNSIITTEARHLDATVEVTGSIPVSPTSLRAGQGLVSRHGVPFGPRSGPTVCRATAVHNGGAATEAPFATAGSGSVAP